MNASDQPGDAAPGLSAEEIRFISEHQRDDVAQLVLRADQYRNVDARKLAMQILARQKAAKKLPEWVANPDLLFPPPLSVEQCSSEATARYKAYITAGNALTDITGGMGIDCFYMGQKFGEVHYFEQQPKVAEAARYNFARLGAGHIHVNASNALERMQTGQFPQSDWLFADPARRDAQKNKVVLLTDCEPDMVSLLPEIFHFAPKILVKTSPLLDIDQAVADLRFVEEVHVVGYEQECKELLFVLAKDALQRDFVIKACVIDAGGAILQQMDFDRNTEQAAETPFSFPEKYLYEPHAAMLKSGGFKSLATIFGVKKLAMHSHLYTSEKLVENFPGRAFEIACVCKPDAKEIIKAIGGNKANLTTRNFPGKTEDLRKKWKLKEGGSDYLFATTLSDHAKVVIVTRKITV